MAGVFVHLSMVVTWDGGERKNVGEIKVKWRSPGVWEREAF
jgi:hypothetical protein